MKSLIVTIGFLLGGFGGFSVYAQQPITFITDGNATLVEVYTSEGCSSCPPADRWLASLANNPDLFIHLVPIGFHVDYWNDIGWPDPFSHASFSKRQRKWARQGNLPVIATPTVIVNGDYFEDWRQGKPAPSTNRVPAELKVTWRGLTDFSIEYLPRAGTLGTRNSANHPISRANAANSFNTHKPARYSANGCLMARHISNRIPRGENRGLTLHHDFIALGCQQVELPPPTKGRFRGEMTINPVVQVNAAEHAFAVWITRQGRLEPVHVIGGMR